MVRKFDNLTKGVYQIATLKKKDIQLIRKWRNEQIAFLRQTKKLSSQEQERYYETTIKPSLTQKNLL